MVSGRTRVAAVIGDPVRHSLSPAIHNAAFSALGLDWVYVALEVRESDVGAALAGVRALGIEGLSVTMPHKAAVAALVDELTPAAAALDAVNCVVNRDGYLLGDNTDGDGFLGGLGRDTGFEVSVERCAVFGAGGAARAVARALGSAGAAEVVVINRSPERAETAAALAGGVGRVGTQADAAGCALVVNATPVGMGSDESVPIDIDGLRRGQVVVDLVYEPAETALLRRLRDRGIEGHNGIAMLVHQAALAFGHWTGEPAPIDAMRSAVGGALGH